MLLQWGDIVGKTCGEDRWGCVCQLYFFLHVTCMFLLHFACSRFLWSDLSVSEDAKVVSYLQLLVVTGYIASALRNSVICG